MCCRSRTLKTLLAIDNRKEKPTGRYTSTPPPHPATNLHPENAPEIHPNLHPGHPDKPFPRHFSPSFKWTTSWKVKMKSQFYNTTINHIRVACLLEVVRLCILPPSHPIYPTQVKMSATVHPNFQSTKSTVSAHENWTKRHCQESRVLNSTLCPSPSSVTVETPLLVMQASLLAVVAGWCSQ